MPNSPQRLKVHMSGDEPVAVTIPPRTNVMVFQRVTHKYLAEAIPLIRAQGVAVVVDIDDDLDRIDGHNAAFDQMHPRHMKSGQSQHSWRMLHVACNNATMVTTSTDTLVKRYARHGRAHIIHNHIPRFYFNIPHEDTDVFGYPGALMTHFNDVSAVGTSVARLMREGHQFMTMGGTDGIERVMGLPCKPIELGATTTMEWPKALTKLGIGIAPLADTEFNRAKSWLKPLELAAVGVPSVYSPRREYMKLNQLGIGYAAQKPKHWYTVLRRLLNNRIERHDVAQRGLEIAKTMILEDHAMEWYDAWHCAYHIQQGEPCGLGDHQHVLASSGTSR